MGLTNSGGKLVEPAIMTKDQEKTPVSAQRALDPHEKPEDRKDTIPPRKRDEYVTEWAL